MNKIFGNSKGDTMTKAKFIANGIENRKPTEQGFAERIDRTKTYLSYGMTKGEIKVELKREFGVNHRTVERYLARARDILLAELREDRESHKAKSLGFYHSVFNDPDASIRDKIRAQQRIDFMLGLYTDTNPASTVTATEHLSRSEIEQAIESMAASLFEHLTPSAKDNVLKPQSSPELP
jgi:hypothetical protein